MYFLIVDVNFDHHIMVNPADGSLVFYYSPQYGLVDTFASFPKLLENMKDSIERYFDMNPFYTLTASITPATCDAALVEYDADVLTPSPSMALAPADVEGIEVLERSEGTDFDSLVRVDLRHGAYKLSRNVAPLQRLFSKRVLRDFDPRLAEVDDESALCRKKSMLGRVFVDELGTKRLIVEDNLGEIVVALGEDGRRTRVAVLNLRKLVRGEGHWATKSLDETLVTYTGKSLPKAWHDVLPQMRPKEIDTGK